MEPYYRFNDEDEISDNAVYRWYPMNVQRETVIPFDDLLNINELPIILVVDD